MYHAKNIVMINQVLFTDRDFQESGFDPPNSRTMDVFTKKVLFTADQLFNNDVSRIDPEKTGAAVCTRTGAFRSLKNTANTINTAGYQGINPSFFPNVMLSTALSHLTMYLHINGPSCVFYDTDRHGKDGLHYCIVQLNLCNADGMILICADEDGWSAGKLLVRR